MLEKWTKLIVQIVLLSGLCASVQANTTADEHVQTVAASISDNAATADTANSTPGHVIRVALLLPLRSAVFGTAADAVRNGFLAAAEQKKDELVITVIETGDAVQEVLDAYEHAAARYDVIVGPLSRSAVTALAQSAAVTRPTIALAQPDLNDGTGRPGLQQMLLMGLSIEDEARQIAAWVDREAASGKIFAISTRTAWQRRAADAFVQQASKIGLSAENLELSLLNNALSASGLAQLAQRVQTEKPSLLFVALDAAQAIQLRNAVGNEIPLYGTSQLNPLTLRSASAAMAGANAADGKPVNPDIRLPGLDGVRLVDMPWQVQADHPAVTVYPPMGTDGNRPNADLERLYALGIDAFRVTEEVAMQHTGFDIDGVTGQLNVNMSGGATYFQRKETQAVYQNGVAIPVSAAH